MVRCRVEMLRHLFAIDWHHCKCCTTRLSPKFSTSKIWNANISEILNTSAKCVMCFIGFLYLPSNGANADFVPHQFDLYFQGQTFSCCAFAKKIWQWQLVFSANLPRLARPPSWSCSCFYCLNESDRESKLIVID